MFLTRDRGKKRGVAKGARRPRSRYMGALEPLTRGEVAYFEREQRELVQLNYVDVGAVAAAGARRARRWGTSATSPSSSTSGRRKRTPTSGCSGSGASMVDAIAGGAPIDKLARYFEYWLLRLQGVYPALACVGCAATLLRRGGDAAARAPVRVPALRAVGRGHGRCRPRRCSSWPSAGSTGPEQLESLPLSATASRELETAHRRLISLHLEKELKSARVLREMRHAR